ncbi:hypothetical protein ACH4VX_23155 [Streptomyces sp. NPDC020731]|uniref:hypothetical protein n=1 Tax=Streptomyces sp. NPDC020731 TaxID=3365085 RepID=UPI00379D13BE
MFVDHVGERYRSDASAIGAEAYEVVVPECFARVAGALSGEARGYAASSSGKALPHGPATVRQAAVLVRDGSLALRAAAGARRAQDSGGTRVGLRP